MEKTRKSQNEIPPSFHRGEDELPFVEFDDGIEFQLLQVDLENELWVVRVRFEPGTTIPTHEHTGEVFAFTISGAWKYLEYEDVNRAGSYLYEPKGSVHTLHVLEENKGITEAWFAVRGANLERDEKGEIENVLDAKTVLEIYLERCREMGLSEPPVIGI